MVSLARAVFAAALLALSVVSVSAADKAFQSDDLDQAAIKLEAQIKSDAGAPQRGPWRCLPCARDRRGLPPRQIAE